MPNLVWDNLSSLHLGRYAEYYAKMEFASYGFQVYTSEVDDHGVDFIAKNAKNEFIEIQVKSLRATNKASYTYILKTKMDINDNNRLVCFIHFINNKYPIVYLIPATAWKNPNVVLVDRNYEKDGQKSSPEWGIYFSEKNRDLLDEYRIENYMNNDLR